MIVLVVLPVWQQQILPSTILFEVGSHWWCMCPCPCSYPVTYCTFPRHTHPLLNSRSGSSSLRPHWTPILATTSPRCIRVMFLSLDSCARSGTSSLSSTLYCNQPGQFTKQLQISDLDRAPLHKCFWNHWNVLSPQSTLFKHPWIYNTQY